MTFEEWWDTHHNRCESSYNNCKDAWEKAKCNDNLKVGRCDQYRIEKLEAELALAYEQIRFLRKAVKYV